MSVTARVRHARTGCLAVTLTLIAAAAPAMEMTFPGPATASVSKSSALASYALPLGPWADGTIPTRRIEGKRTDTAWRVAAPGLTTLQLLAPLRAQLAGAGYTILWECETESCGGFDFRFGTDVLDEPDMHVDLGDFRFLSATQTGPGGPQAISLLVSRSADAGYIQIIIVGDQAEVVPEEPPPAPVAVGPAAAAPEVGEPDDFAGQLERGGFVPLDDLIFESGSARLGAEDFPSLALLADFLKANPGRFVTLVGHTDASGSLAGNVALSKARAASVRDRLIQRHGVAKEQVSAEGVGYLAPRATNLTEAGRAQNRRVEVILTMTN